MTTLKDSIYSAIQDAPGLTASEYAKLVKAEHRMSSIGSTLCALRNSGFIMSQVGPKGLLTYTAVKAKEIGARKAPEKKSNGHKAVVITTHVVVEYDGMKYTLPQEVIEAIRSMK